VGREWLLTNGLGGFASSTVGGLNTRRYHGWLVAQVERYGGRFVVLSKFEEEVRLDGETYRLTTNRYAGGQGGGAGGGGAPPPPGDAAGGAGVWGEGGGPGPIITPRGYRYLQGFDLAPLPVFTYYLRGFFIERTLLMPRGENRVVAVYRLESPRRARLSLRLRPLVTFRFYHHLMQANDWPFHTQAGPVPAGEHEPAGASGAGGRSESGGRAGRPGHGPDRERASGEAPGGGWVTVRPYHDSPVIVFRHDPGRWSPGGAWHRNVEYLEERDRGLDHVEDLYTPGFFEFENLGGGDRVAVSTALAEDDEEAGRLRTALFTVETAAAERRAEEVRLLALVERARTAVEGTALALGHRVDLGGATARPAERRDAQPPEIIDPRTPEASAFFARLVRATDAFIAVRGSGGGGRTDQGVRRTTVIAGYPWFEDWGRDTLISLPGLFLVTGRPGEALRLLRDYASFARGGLIPNRFPDQAREPDYNTADASLWFFAAVGAFLNYTGDREAVEDTLLDSLRHMAASYYRGTDFGIRAGPDGLLHAGEEGVAVTWMDAKLGDRVITPRHGYPVEINALWYNALRLLAELDPGEGPGSVNDCGGGPGGRPGRRDSAGRPGWDTSGPGDAPTWRNLAARVKAAFNNRFWNEEAGCLYDVVHDLESGRPPDASIRPNQLLAVSLPYPVLDPTRWRSVVEVCLRELYVPFGLRTLSRADPAYRGLYRGGPAERDGAYHQGTVWPWLLGPFITALRKAHGYSEESRLVAARILRPFERHLREAGIGHISEVFDGDFPHLPGGCIAQAWSVAEILRAYVEEVLDVRPGAYAAPGRSRSGNGDSKGEDG